MAEGAPALWGDVHASLFAIHEATTDGWDAARLRDHVADLGMQDANVLDCVGEGRYEAWIDENTNVARDAGVTSTPTLLIGGVDAGMPDPAGLREAVTRALAP